MVVDSVSREASKYVCMIKLDVCMLMTATAWSKEVAVDGIV